MQRLEVSGAVRPIYRSLGVKRLISLQIVTQLGKYSDYLANWTMSQFLPEEKNHFVLHGVRGPGQLSRYSESLRAGRSGDQIAVEARFPSPLQTGPGTHPVFCTMSTGSFPRVKRPGRGVDHSPSYNADVKERIELCPYSPSGSSWLFQGESHGVQFGSKKRSRLSPRQRDICVAPSYFSCFIDIILFPQ